MLAGIREILIISTPFDLPGKQSLRAILRTLIKIYTFAPNLNLGQNEYKRRRKVLCLNGSLVSSRVQEQEPSWIL